MSEPTRRQKPLDILILAAGLGTRMRSAIAKVLHEVGGRPLIGYVCRAAAALDPEKICIVVGHQADDVRAAAVRQLAPVVPEFAVQEKQLGTGDAVAAAEDCFAGRDSTILVLSGDVPLIRPETLAALVSQHEAHRGRGAACTILTVRLKDPAGYGRIVRDSEGRFSKIVEERDATPEERTINEVNSGIYCFDGRLLFSALKRVSNRNAQGEYYLTDVPEILREDGHDIAIYQHSDPQEIEGVNNRLQLAEIERLLRRRIVRKLMLDYGVTFIDPKTSYISDEANFGRDVIIYPNVIIEGATEIGDGTIIRSGTRIANSRIGRGVTILDNCLITDSKIDDGCSVGPFAHLRNGAHLKSGAKVGNFVELKKTVLGIGSKANHLSYLGDAEIGDGTNIGAGTITCNYDGKHKHQTRIGNNVKIGSDTMLVAPVTVGDGAATGAGSVVTKDVEPGELVVGVPARPIVKKGTGENG
jgi:bifunctional UDP-N-acetylglucosamine pyrophosphorylase/glucosamine-1-phosphate N-acetyltransferase